MKQNNNKGKKGSYILGRGLSLAPLKQK